MSEICDTKCPYCKEIIKENALKCRYCKSVLTPTDTITKKPSYIIEPEKMNGVDHIGHRVALSFLSGIFFIESLNLPDIKSENQIEDFAWGLTCILCVGIYASVILVKSDENRLWLMIIIGILLTTCGLYLEPIMSTREQNLGS